MVVAVVGHITSDAPVTGDEEALDRLIANRQI